MLVSWAEMPRSHVFYDKLQAVLIAADFDAFLETQCAKEYALRLGWTFQQA
jgi:transposase